MRVKNFIKSAANRDFKRRSIIAAMLAVPILLVAIAAAVYFPGENGDSNHTNSDSAPYNSTDISSTEEKINMNPLAGKKFYLDTTRDINKLHNQFINQGDKINADLAAKIANNPSTIWLTGPTPSDKSADRDIKEVARTSAEAAIAGTVPVYQLYAIPNRDACAAFSKGGFPSDESYLKWLDRILSALKSEAVFIVEADAIGHTLRRTCLTAEQINERYSLLNTAVKKLNKSPKTLAVYLDASHSEWFSDPSILVSALRKSGVGEARGVAVNVSYFVATKEITSWAQNLVSLIGGQKGVVIDTSRNGNGVAPANQDTEARWCNPPGRAIGSVPATIVPDKYIDAYVWVKIAGESDGSCFGNPPAGTFSAAAALELARNAEITN